MRLIARILSTVLHPLLMPTYGMALLGHYSLFFYYPGGEKFVWLLTGLTALFTLVLPMAAIGVMKLCGMIEDVALNNRHERPLPYLMAILCYCFLGALFVRMHVPMKITALVAGSVAALLLCIVITRWWKISAHLTGMGGFVGCMTYTAYLFPIMPLTLLCGFFLLAGMLGTSRIVLGRHTFAQTLAGFVNGFLCVWLAMMLAPLS